jgi:hypothetical protein
MADLRIGFELDAVWPCPSKEVREEVVHFWLSEGALGDAARASKRAAELVIVARGNDRRVAAVSTARRVRVHQLGLNCFYYRMFVGRQHRTKGLLSTDLVRRVLLRSYEVLNDRCRNGHDADCVGLYMEVENESVKRQRNETVWTDFGASVVYIGKTPQGHHARICYCGAVNGRQ